MGSAAAATETLSVVCQTKDLLCRMAGYFRKILGGGLFYINCLPSRWLGSVLDSGAVGRGLKLQS